MAIWRECLAVLEGWREFEGNVLIQFGGNVWQCLAMLGVRLYNGNLEGMFGPIGDFEAIF